METLFKDLDTLFGDIDFSNLSNENFITLLQILVVLSIKYSPNLFPEKLNPYLTIIENNDTIALSKLLFDLKAEIYN